MKTVIISVVLYNMVSITLLIKTITTFNNIQKLNCGLFLIRKLGSGSCLISRIYSTDPVANSTIILLQPCSVQKNYRFPEVRRSDMGRMNCTPDIPDTFQRHSQLTAWHHLKLTLNCPNQSLVDQL